MSENKINQNHTQAFAGIAKNYDVSRPSYPKELFESILSFWRERQVNKSAKPIIADVGCGTGISTRACAVALNNQCLMLGVEPGKDMIDVARKTSPQDFTFYEAPAENLPFATASIDVITAAQAVQWFNRPLFYREAKRVLNAYGVIAIYENNRDWPNSQFLENHEAFLELYSIDEKSKKPYSRYYRDFPYEAELAELFEYAHTLTYAWSRKMTPEAFLAMAKTSTQVRRAEKNIGEKKSDEAILANAKAHVDRDQQVIIRYITKLYMARKGI